MRPRCPCRVLTFLALLSVGASRPAKHWYDGLPNIKVLHPEHGDNQAIVDEVFRIQNNSHFGEHRYALLLMPGQYKDGFGIKVSYYTSVIGVGTTPGEVGLGWVESPNGANGHATNNFWRSVEGVTLFAKEITWAVSQAAPIRRSTIMHGLRLSTSKRYSSGGFMSDVGVHGALSMGTQQQWFFRNVDLWGKIYCPSGWNYVFVGMRGLSIPAQQGCSGSVPGKVMTLGQKFAAEKPFLVTEGGAWFIHVPKFVSHVVGATANIFGWKLDVDNEVFVTRPGMTAAEINHGMKGMKGLLVTPGIYELNVPIEVKDNNFVVLGIGWPTLIATDGRPAVQVANGLHEVRVAGLLIEAGTPMRDKPTEPLFQWGTEPRKEYTLPGTASGLASDIFVRVGSFKYRGCKLVRADTMMEINSDDVVLDHVWLWHADHDDCGTELHTPPGKSDHCHSKHGLVVNGRRVTSYGLAAEHTVAGHMLVWNGEEGDVYFYQSEVPYHQTDWGAKGYAGYVVAPHVERHRAHGVGVYIISSMLEGQVRSAFLLPQYAEVNNLFNVTIGKGQNQFGNLACTQSGGACYKPTRCAPMRCFRPDFPAVKLPPQRLLAFEKLKAAARKRLHRPAVGKKMEEIVRDEVLTEHGKSMHGAEASAPRSGCSSADIRSLAACAQMLPVWTISGLGVLGAAVLAVHSILRARRRPVVGQRALLPRFEDTEGASPTPPGE